MLACACARARVEAVEPLLAADADLEAEGSIHLFSMLSFIARGSSLLLPERLLAAGLPIPERLLSGYFRLVLELTGHRVVFVEPVISRGILGDTDAVWAVDRPMSAPAPLLAPLVSAIPWGSASKTAWLLRWKPSRTIASALSCGPRPSTGETQ